MESSKPIFIANLERSITYIMLRCVGGTWYPWELLLYKGLSNPNDFNRYYDVILLDLKTKHYTSTKLRGSEYGVTWGCRYFVE
jgi:hypothetical protein